MSKYDSVAQAVLREIPPPYSGILLDVITYPEYPDWAYLTLYAHNLSEFSDDQIHSIADWLQKVKDRLNEHPLVHVKFSWNISHEEPKWH